MAETLRYAQGDIVETVPLLIQKVSRTIFWKPFISALDKSVAYIDKPRIVAGQIWRQHGHTRAT